MKTLLVMNAADNVGNAIEDMKAGDQAGYDLDGATRTLTCRTDVPYGFKMAVKDIPEGSDVIKYKEVIGVASRDIAAGDCVHVHNIAGKRGRGDLEGAK